MYNSKVVYINTQEGKKKAIRHLQYAMEDTRAWYLNCPYRITKAKLNIETFNNWIIKDTFNHACFAIINSTRDITFYQMDMTEIDTQDAKRIESMN